MVWELSSYCQFCVDQIYLKSKPQKVKDSTLPHKIKVKTESSPSFLSFAAHVRLLLSRRVREVDLEVQQPRQQWLKAFCLLRAKERKDGCRDTQRQSRAYFTFQNGQHEFHCPETRSERYQVHGKVESHGLGLSLTCLVFPLWRKASSASRVTLLLFPQRVLATIF